MAGPRATGRQSASRRTAKQQSQRAPLHPRPSMGQAGKGQSARGREMVAYLRYNLLLAAASPPGLEAHVGGAELNHATRLCWGSKLSGLTVAHPHRSLWDCRANLHSVLLPPELPEARQPGRRTRPRARTWRAPSATAAPHQPDPPCVAATSATARRTESPDGTGPAERASGRRTPPQTPLEPAQLAAPACFASSFYPPKWLTGGGTRLSHSVIWWRKYHHHMIEGNDVPECMHV